jgi:hypothetical protein
MSATERRAQQIVIKAKAWNATGTTGEVPVTGWPTPRSTEHRRKKKKSDSGFQRDEIKGSCGVFGTQACSAGMAICSQHGGQGFVTSGSVATLLMAQSDALDELRNGWREHQCATVTDGWR